MNREDRTGSSDYVELHCHSNFSFQEGASFPHELLARAAQLGYPALALTDHDNLCGAMEFARTARSLGIQPIIGAEVTIKGAAPGEEHHLTLLSETRQGYANLCRLISSSHVFGQRRHPPTRPPYAARTCRGSHRPLRLPAGRSAQAGSRGQDGRSC